MQSILIGVVITFVFLGYSALVFYLGARLTRKHKIKAVPLTPEQLETKRKRDAVEDQFNKMLGYKVR